MRRLIVALALLGCASPGFPPGGPEDHLPPKLVAIAPDTGAIDTRPRAVIFRFDEVVSERPSGARDLRDLFLISPEQGQPDVNWHRDAIAVRPSRGWRANTTYTVTLLPGLADLRGNVLKTPTATVFSTGPTLARARIAGIIFDWTTGRPAARAIVQGIARPDSVVYVARADSTGRFALEHLPPGRYTLLGFIDANQNNALDPRELWDSTSVALTDSARGELLAFVHDTIGPLITNVVVRDSLTLQVTVDKPIDVTQQLDTTLFTLQRADSTVVPVVRVSAVSEYEREERARLQARADSARRADTSAAGRAARGDTTAVRAPTSPFPVARDTSRDTTRAVPVPSRPVPATELVLRVYPPLQPATTYRLTAKALRGLLGNPRTSSRVFGTPKPAPRTAADSARVPPTTRPASGDTTRRPPPRRP